MPRATCATSALWCFPTRTKVSRISCLRFRNVRPSTFESSRHAFHINSFNLRSQSTCTSRISTSQSSQVRGFHTAPSSVEDPGEGKEMSNRDRNASIIEIKDPIETHRTLDETARIATVPVALRSTRNSRKRERFLKPQPSLSKEVAFDQDWAREKLKGQSQRSDKMSRWPKDFLREEDPGSFNIADQGRKVRRRDFSSRAVEGRRKGARSSLATNAAVGLSTGSQNYKDQREPWQTQKSALSEKFGLTGWSPRKRLSPDTLEGIRALHAQHPDKFTTPVLAAQFKVSPEAIRRILKSKWQPKAEEEEKRRQRWEKRGENIWSQMVEMGIKPPKKWRDMGVGKPTERTPARSAQLEHMIKSKFKAASSLLGQSTTDLHTTPENEHEKSSQVPLADRIL